MIYLSPLLVAFTLALAPQTVAKPDAKPIPPKQAPVISKDIETEFWKKMSAFHSINADLQQALKTEAIDRQLLDEQRKLVNEQEQKIRAACGSDYELNNDQFRKGILQCDEKKKADDTNKASETSPAKPINDKTTTHRPL